MRFRKMLNIGIWSYTEDENMDYDSFFICRMKTSSTMNSR